MIPVVAGQLDAVVVPFVVRDALQVTLELSRSVVLKADIVRLVISFGNHPFPVGIVFLDRFCTP